MQVPTYDNLKVGTTTSPDVQVQNPTGPGGAQIAASELGAAGQATERLGSAGAQIAASMQEQVNLTRVNDAVNKARKAAQDLAYDPNTGYLNLKGDAALTRPNGQDLTAEYGDKLKEQLSQIGGTLGNEAQRVQFQRNASDLQAQFHGQVETHMLGEFRSHALSVQDGTIDLAADDAKRSWNNPDLITPSLNAAKAAVVEKGRISGWSASATQAAMLTTTSKVHTNVVMSALENGNAAYAATYLDARRKEMTADDILRVQGHVNQQVWMGISQGAVDTATRAVMPQIAPTNFDRMHAITAQTESGGRDFAPDGTLLQGPPTKYGTAKGSMQVLDSTAKDPGHGIAPAMVGPDGKIPAAEYSRVGKELLQALVQKYGDPAKAWAAYNWGEGHLDAALKEADADAKTGAYRGGAPADAWMMKLPKETQAYVAKNMEQLGGSGGVAPRPTELEFVNRALAALPPGAPPQVVKMTREQAMSQFTVINKSANEQGQNALAEAQRWLAANQGDIARMPPAIRDAVDRYAPGKSDDLIKYAGVFSTVKEPKTDLALYNRLAAHPDEMARMTDVEFEGLKPHLAPGDFKHFANERSNYLNGKASDGHGAINNAAVNAAIEPRLEALGINAKPAPKDMDGQARVGGIRQFVRDSLFTAQQQAGKKFTPEEVEKHVDGLFAKSVEFRHTVLGMQTGTSTTNLMTLQLSDLPDGAAEGLKQALINGGRKAPTDQDVLNLYRKLHAK